MSISLDYPIEIRWHGRGGQGAVTAAKLLAEIALEAGWQVQSFPQFGSERRGAPITAYTRIDEREITLYNTIRHPNTVIVLDPSLLEIPLVLNGLRDDGLLLVNSALKPDEMRQRLDRRKGYVATVPATAIAARLLKRQVTNVAMLGAFVSLTGIVDQDKLTHHVEAKFSEQYSEKVVEGNLAAMTEAFNKVLLK